MTRLRSRNKLKSDVGRPDLFDSATATYVLPPFSAVAQLFYNGLKFLLKFVPQEGRSLSLRSRAGDFPRWKLIAGGS